MPPAGTVPRPRARITFGRSPKSDQKVCLKPQVSRLPARLPAAQGAALYPAKTKIYGHRRTTNRMYSFPRCCSHAPHRGALRRCCASVAIGAGFYPARVPMFERTPTDAPRRGRRPRRPTFCSLAKGIFRAPARHPFAHGGKRMQKRRQKPMVFGFPSV